MAGKRGRTAGYKLTEEHRGKIRSSVILKRLEQLVTGEIDASLMPAHAVTAALGLLRKVMPDLSATELTGDTKTYVVAAPEVTETAEAWEAEAKPTRAWPYETPKPKH